MILITMAGLSSRFYSAGYNIPKYALPLNGKTIFDYSVLSFEKYFDDEDFLFVIRPDDFAEKFVAEAIERLKIKKSKIFKLNEDTRGQAETAYIALKNVANDFPVTIFNIDTIRYSYSRPDFVSSCDGYLEVFRGEGEHWSFIEPKEDFIVSRTTEKERISDLCSDGLYYFKSSMQFCELFEHALLLGDRVKGEFYVAPLYNYLIKNGGVVKYDIISIDKIDFCGTPAEYEELLKNKGPL